MNAELTWVRIRVAPQCDLVDVIHKEEMIKVAKWGFYESIKVVIKQLVI
jgi:hypothetical protein